MRLQDDELQEPWPGLWPRDGQALPDRRGPDDPSDGEALRRRSRLPERCPKPPGPAPSVETGFVKWYDASRGFGLIRALHGGDVIIHAATVERAGLVLAEGARFRFRRCVDRRNGKATATHLQIL